MSQKDQEEHQIFYEVSGTLEKTRPRKTLGNGRLNLSRLEDFMNVMSAIWRRKGRVPGIPLDWPAGFLMQCDNCGLEWEAFQEHENCPLADLEAELFPGFLENLTKNLDPGTHPECIL